MQRLAPTDRAFLIDVNNKQTVSNCTLKPADILSTDVDEALTASSNLYGDPSTFDPNLQGQWIFEVELENGNNVWHKLKKSIASQEIYLSKVTQIRSNEANTPRYKYLFSVGVNDKRNLLHIAEIYDYLLANEIITPDQIISFQSQLQADNSPNKEAGDYLYKSVNLPEYLINFFRDHIIKIAKIKLFIKDDPNDQEVLTQFIEKLKALLDNANATLRFANQNKKTTQEILSTPEFISISDWTSLLATLINFGSSVIALTQTRYKLQEQSVKNPRLKEFSANPGLKELNLSLKQAFIKACTEDNIETLSANTNQLIYLTTTLDKFFLLVAAYLKSNNTNPAIIITLNKLLNRIATLRIDWDQNIDVILSSQLMLIIAKTAANLEACFNLSMHEDDLAENMKALDRLLNPETISITAIADLAQEYYIKHSEADETMDDKTYQVYQQTEMHLRGLYYDVRNIYLDSPHIDNVLKEQFLSASVARILTKLKAAPSDEIQDRTYNVLLKHTLNRLKLEIKALAEIENKIEPINHHFSASLWSLYKNLKNDINQQADAGTSAKNILTSPAYQTAENTIRLLRDIQNPKLSQKQKLEGFRDYETLCAQPTSCMRGFLKAVAAVIITGIGFVLGAAIGFAAGFFAGAWTGPGAAATAVFGLVQGAITGYAIGLVAASAAGTAIGAKVGHHRLFKPSAREQQIQEVITSGEAYLNRNLIR